MRDVENQPTEVVENHTIRLDQNKYMLTMASYDCECHHVWHMPVNIQVSFYDIPVLFELQEVPKAGAVNKVL